VPIDRETTLKQAEKLLRQGRLDAAIAEYVRLVQDQPRDWNSINALGDLYTRAGQTEKAVAQFTLVADYLAAEGFLPRAAALYKKILKIKSDDEHALLQLADIATRQELIVDAKMYLRQAAEFRRMRGDRRGVAEMAIRLGTLDPDDGDAKLAAARASAELGDALAASGLLQEAADSFEKQNRSTEALAVLAEAAALDPENSNLRGRIARDAVAAGDFDRAREYLSPESAGDDPDLLLALARMEFLAGRAESGRAALTRLLSIAPQHRDAAVVVACGLIEQGNAEGAFTCVDLVADFALLNADCAGAADALEAFVSRLGGHIPALLKLVEICVDGGFDNRMVSAQARLADAYLAAGQGAEARVIAEDLMLRNPEDRDAIERLRRALVLMGVADPDAEIAERLNTDDPFAFGEDTFALSDVDLAREEPQVFPAAQEAPPPQHSDEPVVLEAMEIDLSAALGALVSTPPPPPPPAADAPPADILAPDLEAVFGGFRARAASEDEAQQQYEAGLRLVAEGRLDEALKALELAARVPRMRYDAASALGRLHIGRGDVSHGVEWLERAAEAPAPTRESGIALLYDLAEALERSGEGARALAILLEIEIDAPGYRDVSAHVERLSKVQTRG